MIFHLIKLCPRLASFLNMKKCVATAALEGFLKLVAPDHSAKSCSLASLMDLVLEEDGVTKSFALYLERRFTKLGYSAGSVVDCIPQFEKVLERTHLNNLLVEACRLYISNDYIIAALRCLSFFTRKVTMPYLNFIEKGNQQDLVEMLPKLYMDLKQGKVDTLERYEVEWTHVQEHPPTGELEKYIIYQMCRLTAEGVKLQCGREYWKDERQPKVTVLHELPKDQLLNIPTHNIASERLLARFGYLASVSAVHSNRWFKAKRIRDDIMFHNTGGGGDMSPATNKETHDILKKMKSMESEWTTKQKEKGKARTQESLLKKRQKEDYGNYLLMKCKEHNGPIATVEELTQLVENTPKAKIKSILRNEVGLKRILNPHDFRDRPEYYSLNNMSPDKFQKNLTILLQDNRLPTSQPESENEILPDCEEQIMSIIRNNSPGPTEYSHFLQPVATVWDNGDGRSWCIGFIIEVRESDTTIENLKQLDGESTFLMAFWCKK